MKEKCKSCPFWEPTNGVCYFPGNCDLPEDYEILKLMMLKTKLTSIYGSGVFDEVHNESIEEAQKEIRS